MALACAHYSIYAIHTYMQAHARIHNADILYISMYTYMHICTHTLTMLPYFIKYIYSPLSSHPAATRVYTINLYDIHM
jgi:hypothetical protein